EQAPGRQPRGAQRGARGAEREALGMRGRVAPPLDLVVGAREQLAVRTEHDGADRDLVLGLRGAGLLERPVHRAQAVDNLWSQVRRRLGRRGHVEAGAQQRAERGSRGTEEWYTQEDLNLQPSVP